MAFGRQTTPEPTLRRGRRASGRPVKPDSRRENRRYLATRVRRSYDRGRLLPGACPGRCQMGNVGWEVTPMEPETRTAKAPSAFAAIAWKAAVFAGVALESVFAASRGHCEDLQLFVSPSGSDTQPGTKTEPFRSLERARDAARSLPHDRQRIVWLRGGVYERAKPLELTAA